MQYIGCVQAQQMPNIVLNAERFLHMMSKLAIGWLLLEASSIAIENLAKDDLSAQDRAFYLGKKMSGIFYAMNIVTEVVGSARMLRAADASPLAMTDEAFGPAL